MAAVAARAKSSRRIWLFDSFGGMPIAILRIDGDWYESTKVCIEQLYDNVIRGGYVIIDDYGYFKDARKQSMSSLNAESWMSIW